MTDLFGIFSVVIFGCGLYGIYAYLEMRRNGHINTVLLLGKGYTEQMCKNKEEYMQRALPAVLIFGVVTTVYGAVDIVNTFLVPIPVVEMVGMGIFLGVLFWFMYYTVKLKNRYF